MIYFEMFLVACVTIYVVDLSGFTDAWRNALARILKIKALRPLKPFDCGKCMTWWLSLAYCLFTGHLSLFTIAFAALLSLLSFPIGRIFIFTTEWLQFLIEKLMPKW